MAAGEPKEERKKEDIYYVIDIPSGVTETRTKEELEQDLMDDVRLEQRMNDGDVVVIRGLRIYADVERKVTLEEDE